MSLPPIVEVPQELIVVTRDERQRTDLDPDGVAKLAADIRRHGLLNAIIVEDTNDEDRALVRVIAGERRLAACRSLGWSHIPCRFWSELSPLDRQRLEWAENAHRTDLPWPDRARAIAAYHEAALAEVAGTSKGWRVADTAHDLGLASAGYVCLNILVAQAAKARPELWTLTSVRQAYNAIERQNGRELGNVLAEVLEGMDDSPEEMLHNDVLEDEEDVDFDGSSLYEDGDVVVTTGGAAAVVEVPRSRPVLAKPPTPAPARFSIHNTDFASWADAYTGPPFTVLHLDPPYGIGFTNTGMFRKANALDEFYDDNQSDLDGFFAVLAQHYKRLIAPAAHIVYWYSADRYTENMDRWLHLSEAWGNDDVWINPIPLIWHKSNNRGMMTTPDKRPRHVYETAFLITVGGQKLARPMGTDVVSEPADPSLHPSAKPLKVVRTWLEGVVDASSRVLDPTCGHGSAIQAALELGAREAVGVELDPTHAARAKVEIATQARELQALETVSL